MEFTSSYEEDLSFMDERRPLTCVFFTHSSDRGTSSTAWNVAPLYRTETSPLFVECHYWASKSPCRIILVWKF